VVGECQNVGSEGGAAWRRFSHTSGVTVGVGQRRAVSKLRVFATGNNVAECWPHTTIMVHLEDEAVSMAAEVACWYVANGEAQHSSIFFLEIWSQI
jgi:nitrogen regulatory protein PII